MRKSVAQLGVEMARVIEGEDPGRAADLILAGLLEAVHLLELNASDHDDIEGWLHALTEEP